jgi:WhiB family redox-sensing transcriptional regulator
MSVDFFFDPDREDEAKGVCAACPVNATCLAYALHQPDLEGFWGGMTAESRRELRQRSFAAAG